MRLGLSFVGRYVLAASLVLSVWTWIGPRYVDLVAPAANLLSVLQELPVRLEREGSHLLFRYTLDGRSFRLEALGQESIYLNLVAALSLLAATPGRRPLWYAGWGALASVLLWATHVASFYMGGQFALWQYAATGPAAASMVAPLAAALPHARAVWMQAALEHWSIWGQYSLCVALWIVAALRPVPEPRGARMPAPSRIRQVASVAG